MTRAVGRASWAVAVGPTATVKIVRRNMRKAGDRDMDDLSIAICTVDRIRDEHTTRARAAKRDTFSG
jgi:hypothetical protein